jgi:hypothetical protein
MVFREILKRPLKFKVLKQSTDFKNKPMSETPVIYQTDRSKIKAIGGSQIAAICGIDKFNTPLDIYNLLINDKREPENKHMKAGKMLDGSSVF